MSTLKSQWAGRISMIPKQYTCGHCEREIASHEGFFSGKRVENAKETIYLCPYCDRPTHFYKIKQVPSPLFGGKVEHLPDDINKLYNEARECTSVNAYTATILACRKILLHIAVQKGAKAGESFASYVDFLAKNNFVPPGSEKWIERIRTKGNEANHEIVIMEGEDAKDLLNFLHMLMKFMYEFPGKFVAPSTEGEAS